MKKYITILVACVVAAGCSSLNIDRSIVENTAEIGGVYNVIMVGGTFRADAERLVILDVVNDDNTFRAVTAPGRVKVFSELDADEALQKAEMFFSEHCAYNGYQIKKLNRPDSGFIGYELTPDYPPAICEDGNVLQVGYGRGDEGQTKVYTWLLLKKESGGSRIDAAKIPGK